MNLFLGGVEGTELVSGGQCFKFVGGKLTDFPRRE
jgi:hypothetical protein